jgi:hypothetical protein
MDNMQNVSNMAYMQGVSWLLFRDIVRITEISSLDSLSVFKLLSLATLSYELYESPNCTIQFHFYMPNNKVSENCKPDICNHS